MGTYYTEIIFRGLVWGEHMVCHNWWMTTLLIYDHFSCKRNFRPSRRNCNKFLIALPQQFVPPSLSTKNYIKLRTIYLNLPIPKWRKYILKLWIIFTHAKNDWDHTLLLKTLHDLSETMTMKLLTVFFACPIIQFFWKAHYEEIIQLLHITNILSHSSKEQ